MLHLRFIIQLQLISKSHLVYSQSSVRHNDSKVYFFLFLIWMCTFHTNNRTFKTRIMTVDQCSLDCCFGVFISTLCKYLSDKLYHYTYYDFFSELDQQLYHFLSLIVYMSVVQATANLNILYNRCRLRCQETLKSSHLKSVIFSSAYYPDLFW